jgi:protein gp37
MVKDVHGGLKESGCAFCYAKDRDDRQLQEKVSHWGKGAKRLKHVGAVKSALAMNRKPWISDITGTAYAVSQATEEGKPFEGFHRRRVFSLSLGDWLDDEVPIEWLCEMLDTIRICRNVRWLLCTKRPENWHNLVVRVQNVAASTGNWKLSTWCACWLRGTPSTHILLLTSVENQAMADKRIPELLKIPAACHGLSMEPLLSEVILPTNIEDEDPAIGAWIGNEFKKIDWIICGCESGSKRRFQDGYAESARSLNEQGKAAGVAVFNKQMPINGNVSHDPNEWPEWASAQQWPKGFE